MKSGSRTMIFVADGQRVETRSKRRFLNCTRLINWKNALVDVSLKVIYGTGKDHREKSVTFINEGRYKNKHDFTQSLNAFLE